MVHQAVPLTLLTYCNEVEKGEDWQPHQIHVDVVHTS